MFGKKKKTTVNLMEIVPETNYSWETTDDGLVVVLIPKFKNKFLARWLLPRFKKPHYRLNLDQHGSFAWTAFDGKTPVDDLESAVVTQRVFSADIVEAAFEGMVQPGNLVPFAQVPAAVKPVYRLNIFRQTGAGV